VGKSAAMVGGKTKAAIANSVAPICGEAALHLSGYHNIPLAIILAIVAVLALVYAIWHGVNMAWRKRLA
jgi:hypothetical protein